MESILIYQRLRPLRYGLMIKDRDLDSALVGVSLNTVTWGGIYNPIVPTTPIDECNELLKEFDPDLLIDFTDSALPENIKNLYKERIVLSGELVQRDTYTSKRLLRLGHNLLPILHNIHDKEIRFLPEKSNVALISTEAADGWPQYLAFINGSFSYLPETDSDFKSIFKELLRPKEITFDPERIGDEVWKVVSPLRVTRHGLQLLRGWSGLSSHIIYIGHHNNFLDLIDFWNIRATGRTVLFVPSACYKAYLPIIKRVAELGRYPINPHMENEVDIQKSPSLPQDVFEEVCQWLGAQGVGMLARRYGSPRFGISERAAVSEIEAQTGEEISILQNSQMTPVKLITPSHLEEGRVRKSDYEWAIELRMSGGWRNNEYMFTFPFQPSVERLVRHGFMAGPREVRLARNGVVLFRDTLRERLFLSPIQTVDVFSCLFEQVGLRTEPSQPGRYTEQIIKKMGSVSFDCRIFKVRGLREILSRLSNGSVLTKGNMYQAVMSTTPDRFGQNWRPDFYDNLIIRTGQRGNLDFSMIFDELLEKGVIRPGYTLRCKDCFGEDWYHVSEFDEKFICRYCFSSQRVNFGTMHEWQYKSDGLFRIPDSALGSLAVIISIWRFEQQKSMREGSYLCSVNIEGRGNFRCELDYAFLQIKEFSTSYDLVLGQAASFTDFTEPEINNMKVLSEYFEHKVYLAFSTLKDAFSIYEKEQLNKLVTEGHRIIALTRIELDPYDLFERFKDAPYKYPVTFEELSENTIRLNLS